MALYKRPDSKYWWMKFTFDGRLIQKSTRVSSKRDAGTIESAYRTQLALGKVGIMPKVKAPAFKKAVEDFLAWSKIEHAKKISYFTRMEFDCLPLKEFFGEMSVDLIEVKEVEKYIAWRLGKTSRKTGKPITRGTVNREIVILKTILKRLVSKKILTENPVKEIKRLSENERKFHVISSSEKNAYLLASPQPLRDVAALMLETGMRPAEIFQLKRRQVNTEKGFLQVENGKTKSSNRKVWLSDQAIKLLRYRLEKFKGENLFPKNDADGEPPVETLNALHLKTARALGFDFRLYDCRHTFATRVLESGIDLLTLASMLGHSGLGEVTRYAHPSETRKSDAVRKMQFKETEQAKAAN